MTIIVCHDIEVGLRKMMEEKWEEEEKMTEQTRMNDD
jgi:hypothetical protein